MLDGTTSGPPPGLSPARAILYGTAVVGTLDILDALIFFGLRGVAPARIFQAIASGLLGRDSFQAGAASVALGAFLQYFISFGIVSIYMLASRWLEPLRRHPVICGALYGIAAYFFMQRVVIPLSAATVSPKTFGAVLINGLFAHVFLVGIPSALAARAARRPRPSAGPAAVTA